MPQGRQALARGRDSAFALADKIGTRPITCSGDEFDRYQRLVARCSLNGERSRRMGWLRMAGRWPSTYAEQIGVRVVVCCWPAHTPLPSPQWLPALQDLGVPAWDLAREIQRAATDFPDGAAITPLAPDIAKAID